ncbi:hypothetical protein PanWU01x14_238790 [Parasponia andersonii]|uniref:Uncharacterized protein n=1 Tax=Parasponia andersonii TaxID=3476 RepID=A0A2P5BHF9_PARAD|nr:hypothetical protein PanWU01x14_238790 [Parasponia andersonii]
MPRTFPVPMQVPGRRKRLRQITMELPSTLNMDLSTAVTVTSQNNDNPTVTSPANANGSGAANNPLPQFPNQSSTDSDQEATNVEAFLLARVELLLMEVSIDLLQWQVKRRPRMLKPFLLKEAAAANAEAFPAGESRTAESSNHSIRAPQDPLKELC